MSGRPIRAKYKNFKTFCEQTSDNSPTDSNSSFYELMVIQTKMRNFVQLLHFFICQLTVWLNAFFEHVLPCRRTTLLFVREVFLIPVIFLLLQQKCVIRTSLCTVQWLFHVGSSISTSFISFFHIGAKFFFPALFLSSTYTDRKQALFTMNQQTCQIEIFSHPSSTKACSNCLSHSNPAKRCPYKFRSRGTTGSAIFSHDFDHLFRGRRTQTSGHSDFGILSNFGASSNVPGCRM